MGVIRGVVSFGVIVFLLLTILPYSSASRLLLSTEKVKTLRFHGKSTNHIHKDLNPFFVSKRKVPNGPDPIHNRRENTSRRSPRVR